MRRLKTVRRPPIYPKTPGHLPCSSLTHPLPLSSRRPSVSFGGFGISFRYRPPVHSVLATSSASSSRPCAPTDRDLRGGCDRGFVGRVQRGSSPLWWGLWVPPNPFPLCFPPRKRPESRRRRAHGHAPLKSKSHRNARRALRRESPEREQPSLVGLVGTPQPLSALLPAREAGGGPERVGAHGRAPYKMGTEVTRGQLRC